MQRTAWAKAGDVWKAVVRIVISGTPENQTLTRYGADGKALEAKEIFSVTPRPDPPPPT